MMRKKRHPSEHSGLIVKTAAKVMPAVVSIAITKHLSKLEDAIGKEFWQISGAPFSEEAIPSELIDAKGMVRIGGGSGFFVRKDGIILTNRHVLADQDAEYTVVWQDQRYPCEVLARDPINDVAVLRIAERDVPIVTLGDSAGLALGETVVAIGNALGAFSNTISTGIISGLSRYIFAAGEVPERGQELRGLIQTDAAINPGNSGGPLVNLNAEAVAINAAVLSGAENIGFAIPIDHAKRDLADFAAYGRIRKPFIGIRYIVLNENLKSKHHLPFAHGAYILREAGLGESGIVAHSPAAAVGLKEGDIVLECEGRPITLEYTLQDALEKRNVGDAVLLKVWRQEQGRSGVASFASGSEFEISIKLSERK